MRRILLFVFLMSSGCSLNVTPTPTSYFDSSTAVSSGLPAEAADLTVNSTSEQIQLAMLNSAATWKTVAFQGKVTWFDLDGKAVQGSEEQVWIDPLSSRYKVEITGVSNSREKSLRLSDGSNIYNVDLNSGTVETLAFPDTARVGQYIPTLLEGEAHPNPLWGQIGTQLAQLAFPSDYAQNRGIFTAIEVTSVGGRDALMVEWRFTSESAPFWKLWLDTQTALILKLQEFAKDGSGLLQSERVIDQIEYDQILDASLFVPPTDLPIAAAPTQAGSLPLVTQSSPGSTQDVGDLYFFLQPHQPGKSIQLVRVSGICVSDALNCPPLEYIGAPFAFNFTINALSWAPDGKRAAFSYSDSASGTPTKLWLFEASTKAWTSIAQFPYIDPPFWSRDGSWIAFRTQDGTGGEDVYVIRPDGTELKSISTDLPASGRPYIMDGWYTENVIMRSALPGHEGSIYLVRAANGQARPMFDTLLTKAQFVAAPDASLLAYDEYDGSSQNHVLKVMEPDGANAVALANFAGGSIYPLVWSADSRWIAFNYYKNFSNGEPSAEVYVVSRNGEKLSLVYKGVTVGRLIFSPNGQYLLVEETTSATGGHLYLVDLATLDQRLLQAPGLSTDFDWYAPSWSP